MEISTTMKFFLVRNAQYIWLAASLVLAIVFFLFLPFGYEIVIVLELVAIPFIIFFIFTKLTLPILLILSLVSLTAGNIVRIPNLLLGEILLPVMVLSFVFRNFKNIKSISASTIRSWIAIFAVANLAVLLLNFARNPLLPANLLGVSETMGGFRKYYTAMINIAGLLLAFWITYKGNGNLAIIRKLLWLISLGFVAYGLIVWVTGENINFPFLPDTLYWRGENLASIYTYQTFTNKALRIGFLGTFGPIVAIGSLILIPKNTFQRLIQFMGIFAGFSVTMLSGGRSSFLGLIGAFIAFYLILSRGRIWRDASIYVIALILGGIFFIRFAPGQVERILSLSGGLVEQMPTRLILFRVYWSEFISHPLFGSGFGVKPAIALPPSLSSSQRVFIVDQLLSGGHGAFLSVFFTFGAFGGVVWFGLLLSSIVAALRNALTFPVSGSALSFFARFGFLWLIFIIPVYITGGNGYEDPWTFLVIGIIAGISRLRKKTLPVSL